MTEGGLWQVIRITFAFLNKLKRRGGSTPEYLRDLKYKNLIDFFFQAKKPPKIAVVEWAQKLDQWVDEEIDKAQS